MLKSKPNNKGFTLVELIITVAIMTLIGLAMVGIMSSNTVVFRKTKSDIDVQNIAQDTFNKISDDIMQAKAVFVETASNTKYITALNSSYVTTDDQVLYSKFNSVFSGAANDFTAFPATGAKIKTIGIAYVVPTDSKYADSGYTNPVCYCVVKYDFDATNKTIKYSADYYGMDILDCTDTLYNDMLNSDGVFCKIDPQGNSINLSMTFEKNNRKFKSEGMVTIRNSYVLSTP